MHALRVLFPTEPRDFPYRRTVRTVLRALHILTAGTLLGGHIFAQPEALLAPWGFAAVASGLALLLTDLHASFAVLFEARGIAMMLKVLLMLLVMAFPTAAVPLLVSVLVVGAVSSHLPGRYRHRLFLLGDWLRPDRRRG